MINTILHEDFVRPGQMRWLVLKAGQKYSKSKKLSDMRAYPCYIDPGDARRRGPGKECKERQLLRKTDR